MPGKDVEYIQPPNNLRQKQKLAGVNMILDPSWVDAAELKIAAAQTDYLQAAQEDMKRMSVAYDRAMSDPANRVVHMEELYSVVQSIKGQGTSFGYPLMTAVGTQLARFIEDCGENLGMSRLMLKRGEQALPALSL